MSYENPRQIQFGQICPTACLNPISQANAEKKNLYINSHLTTSQGHFIVSLFLVRFTTHGTQSEGNCSQANIPTGAPNCRIHMRFELFTTVLSLVTRHWQLRHTFL